jgi:uncharacterized protein
MDDDFAGRGLAFPLRPGVSGLGESAGVAKVEESMRIILGTRPGERVMRPQFGCELGSLVFSPNNSSTADLARYYVTDALTRWEPRIDVLDVVIGNDSLRGHLVIDVRYRLRALGAIQTLVHRLPLEGTG